MRYIVSFKLLVTFLALGEFQTWAQSNLLANPSFEQGGINPLRPPCTLNEIPGWEFGANSGRCPSLGCPDGNAIARFYPFLSQNVATVPGRRYYLRFASQVAGIGASFGDQIANTLTNVGGTNFYFNQAWFQSYCHFTASSTVTRLSLLSTQEVNVDNLLLGWLDEPVRLIQPPADTEVPQGGRIAMQVEADGGPPLSYQWFKDLVPISGATQAVYYSGQAAADDAGRYHVAVSNHVGSVVSDPVQLTVNLAERAPQLVYQPEGFRAMAGTYTTIRAAASGTPPLQFQWRKFGTNLIDATNAVIAFAPLAPDHAGDYEVIVENAVGSTVSLPATVTVMTAARVGLLWVTASFFPGFRNPVYDVDGVTALAGPAYRCQLYAGTSPDQLAPVNLPKEFRTNGLPTAFISSYVTFPDASDNWKVYYQMKAWESAFGASYEEARALGGKVGSSLLLDLIVRSVDYPPEQVPSPIFKLRAGLPGFTTGQISPGSKSPEGLQEWVLTGARGYTYLIERRHPPNTWLPLMTLSNATGTVTFSDPDQLNASKAFYRARILD